METADTVSGLTTKNFQKKLKDSLKTLIELKKYLLHLSRRMKSQFENNGFADRCPQTGIWRLSSSQSYVFLRSSKIIQKSQAFLRC